MGVEIREYRPEDWDALARAHDAARLQELAPSVGVQAFRPLAETARREGSSTTSCGWPSVTARSWASSLSRTPR
ncbi:hypothetical protein [Blastococcus brunescens]|uniref:N-acetyltransferase domain-containing protein n=1 Tax=Blastococcus brunescens TaxID=1564165 RepID=A0ABZ1B1C3_9ACTN|nr:hypothetical protein [Blastococcus sp. BMG 8361]WRL63966.1 hypothetical protein U6N30_30960 [Blastococcus sp. BMG 8361]